MTQQYIRKASLVIGVDEAALDLSNMQFSFNVQPFHLGAPKTAYIRVYNLSADTARKVTTEGAFVSLSAGYEGNFGPIFQGQLIQARMGRENGTATYLDITAADGDLIFNEAVVNVSLAAGSDVIGRLRTIATSANIPQGVNQAPASGAKLSRGVVLFGMARDHFRRECSGVGAKWSINNGKLDVILEGGYSDDQGPVITPATGLIGVPEQNELGINFRCLLNPNIRQNMQVRLDNTTIRQFGFSTATGAQADQLFDVPPLPGNGIYTVLYVAYTGDTRGNDWYCDVVAYSKLMNKAQLQFAPVQA